MSQETLLNGVVSIDESLACRHFFIRNSRSASRTSNNLCHDIHCKWFYFGNLFAAQLQIPQFSRSTRDKKGDRVYVDQSWNMREDEMSIIALRNEFRLFYVSAAQLPIWSAIHFPPEIAHFFMRPFYVAVSTAIQFAFYGHRRPFCRSRSLILIRQQ